MDVLDEVQGPVFKDGLGRYYTATLFWEISPERDKAIFTLQDKHREIDGVTYLSLKQLYLEEADPTEYSFASKYLDSWKHWQRIADMGAFYNNAPVRDYIAEWREELEIKLRSAALKSIAAKSLQDNGYQAAKYLADAGWKPAKQRKNTKVKQAVKDEVADDFERLGLTRIK